MSRIRGAVALLLLCAAMSAAVAQSTGSAALLRRGTDSMLAEDWYAASEAFLEILRLNPSHAQAMASLAECYFSLEEFDQALSYVRKARQLSRADTRLMNLEAAILIAQGKLTDADSLLRSVLAREPNNSDALFTQAELDLARGKASEAAERYRLVVSRHGDDRRALLSLALVLNSLGDRKNARIFAEKALKLHPDDPHVLYYCAYLDASGGSPELAAARLEQALRIRPRYPEAQALLAQLRYRAGNWDAAIAMCDQLIRARRETVSAWYLKALSVMRKGNPVEARALLATTLSIDPADEFARVTLEQLLMDGTPVESSERIPWARYHFDRARDFRIRNLAEQSLFEYRRALRLYPYARERAEYAALLGDLGYPSRKLMELRFLQDLGVSDTAINDAVEAYDSLLADTLLRRWGVDPLSLSTRHWKLAVMTLDTQASLVHVDAALVASGLIRDLLVHEDSIESVDVPLTQTSFSQAFRTAREAGADYFLLVGCGESERDVSIAASVYVARTGSEAGTFRAYMTGADRLRNTAKSIVDQVRAALPLRASLLVRRGGSALVDAGKARSLAVGQILDIVSAGKLGTRNEGIGVQYAPEDLIGSFTITEMDELVSAGSLARNGFFDRIAVGDELVARPAEASTGIPAGQAPPQATPAQLGSRALDRSDPALRTLVRSLR